MKVHMVSTFLHLDRSVGDDFQTLGRLLYYEELVLKGDWVALEPPWRGNQPNRSCIPNGWYEVRPRTSQRYGRHLHITGVEGRSFILIHPGNYRPQTQGCVLPGKTFVDINGDGHLDVSASRQAMGEMLDAIEEPVAMLVTSQFPLA